MKTHRQSQSSGLSGNQTKHKPKSKSPSNHSWKLFSNIISNKSPYSKPKSLKQIKKKIKTKFNSKYCNNKDYYNIKTINEIICNENAHIVAWFKDYLITGDYSEFLQKYYSANESREHLPKIIEYYESCSVIFPNYVILHESKYIYKNIKRKQRVIDIQQEWENNWERMKTRGPMCKKEKDVMFNTEAIDSIWNITSTSVVRGIMGCEGEKKWGEMSNSRGENSNSLDNIWNKIESAERDICLFHSPIRVASKIVKMKKKNKHDNYKNPINAAILVNVNMSWDKKSLSKGKEIKSAVSRNVNNVIKSNTNSKNTNNSGYISSGTNAWNARQKHSATIEQEIHHHNINININNTNFNINPIQKSINKRIWYHHHSGNSSNNCLNNSNFIKKSWIRSWLSSNKDIVIKASKVIKKSSVNDNREHSQNKKINIINNNNNSNSNKNINNNSNNKISSSSSSKTLYKGEQNATTCKSLKLKNKIKNMVSLYSSTKHMTRIGSNKDIILSSSPLLSNNRWWGKLETPWTTREPQKQVIHPDIINMWNQRLTRGISINNSMNNHQNTIKKSASSSQKKLMGYLNASIPLNGNPEQNNNPYPKNQKHGTNNIIKYRNRYQNGVANKEKRRTAWSPNHSTRCNKQIYFTTHYKAKTNINIEGMTTYKKQPNIVIARKDSAIKGIQIKGFDELWRRSNSRNYYTDRMNTNPGSKTTKNATTK